MFEFVKQNADTAIYLNNLRFLFLKCLKRMNRSLISFLHVLIRNRMYSACIFDSIEIKGIIRTLGFTFLYTLLLF